MNDMERIPFNRPCFQGQELVFIAEAIGLGHISGDGAFTKKCQDFLEDKLGVGRAMLTPSCTHALEMAALLLNLEPVDEIIFPSFTFVSTVNAFVLHGAKPVFVDVRPDTLNIDENRIEEVITDRTRAIVVVHYAGVGCEMDTILEIAERRGLTIVEDNAHGLFAEYKDRKLGTFGALATLSFHETKNVTCGEGGALLINDPALVERADVIRQKGTNRKAFFEGRVDKYSWVDVGSSYVLSDVLAAFLFAQLGKLGSIQRQRQWIWDYYDSALRDWARERGVGLPTVPDCCLQAHHMYYMLLPTFEERRALIAHLDKRGILAVFHYQPLHLSEMGRRYGGREGDCPVTESVSDRLLRLPFFNELTEAEQKRVVDAILDFP